MVHWHVLAYWVLVMSNRIVFVCGSPGAGKSSVIEGISHNKNYKVVNVGTIMIDIAMKRWLCQGQG